MNAPDRIHHVATCELSSVFVLLPAICEVLGIAIRCHSTFTESPCYVSAGILDRSAGDTT